MMAEGGSNQAICEQLFLSPKTVEKHVGSMFSKLGLLPAADDHCRLTVLAYLRKAWMQRGCPRFMGLRRSCMIAVVTCRLLKATDPRHSTPPTCGECVTDQAEPSPIR